jgi:hypothetical protein
MRSLVASNCVEQYRIKFASRTHINIAYFINLSVYYLKQLYSWFYRLTTVYDKMTINLHQMVLQSMAVPLLRENFFYIIIIIIIIIITLKR